MRDLRPIRVSSSMSMADLVKLFRQPEMDRSSFRLLHPALQGTCVPCVPVEQGALPELSLHINMDDCESSALTAQVMKKTCVDAHARGASDPDKLHAMCDGWQAFKAFTSKSWSLMSAILDRGCGMIHRGELVVSTAVGLASNASADQVREDEQNVRFSGHCFNVSRIKTPDMPSARFGILEGTAPMYMLTSKAGAPKANVTMVETRDGVDSKVEKTIDMPKFLTMLGASVMHQTQIINCPKGGESNQPSGWPLDVKVTGWRMRTMVMTALDSDPSAELQFYNRVFYMGLPCTEGGQGCMPVDERPSITAGCHPFNLNDLECRAVSAAMPFTDSVQIMRAVMEETTPPMAPEGVLRDLGNKWLPCRPLESVNTDRQREAGVVYHRICAMESPCAPEYLSVIYEIKQRIAAETNRINKSAPNSDGITVTALLEGLSVVLAVDVPYREIKHLTFMASMEQAMENLGCPTPPKK